MRSCFTLFMLFLAGSVCAQLTFDPNRNEVTGSSYTDYYLYTPSEESGAAEKGVIVFLHGNRPSLAGTADIGWGNIFDNDQGMPYILSTTGLFNAYADDYYIMIPHHHKATQNDSAEWIMPELKTLIDNKIIDWNAGGPPVDPDKIVIVGFSLGGKGAWDFAENYPGFAAGVLATWGSALPNGADGVDWCNFTQTPIWAINGEEDELFPPDGTSDTGRYGVNLIESTVFGCNPDAPFNKTLLPGRNHYGWHELFMLQAGYDVYEWMTTVDRGISDYMPTVYVGEDKTIPANSEQYIVYGFSQDILNETLTGVWTYEDLTAAITLNEPTITSREETGEYIILEGFETGHEYLITLTVDDGTTQVADAMTLTAVNPTGLPEVTDISFTIDGQTIPLNNEDEIDITQFYGATPEDTDLIFDNFNVTATTDAVWVRGEINSHRLHNGGDGPDYNYQEWIFGSNGGPNLQLFESGTQRLTFTLNLYEPNSLISNYRITYQVSAYFTDTPLPITLLSFTGRVEDDGVRLDWTTTEEEGNSHFEIFRGRSGDDLIRVAEVTKAAPGNLYNYYSFTDAEAADGVYYYQLQSVDYDGHRDISDIIRVAVTPGEEFAVYPNPSVNGQFHITYSGDQMPALYNSHGQQVDFILAPSANGPGERQLILRNPRPGMYLLKTWHQGLPVMRKVLVE